VSNNEHAVDRRVAIHQRDVHTSVGDGRRHVRKLCGSVAAALVAVRLGDERGAKALCGDVGDLVAADHTSVGD